MIADTNIQTTTQVPIIGYEGLYEISIDGKVVSCERRFVTKIGKRYTIRKRLKRPTIGSHGYYMVALFKNNIEERVLLHRLIAKHFIPNPDCLPVINHKNGIRTDNRIENLEWCTYSDNIKHGYDFLPRLRTTGQIRKRGHECHASKPIAKIENGLIVDVYFNAHDAAMKNNISRNSIQVTISGLRPVKKLIGLFRYITKKEYDEFKRSSIIT